MHLLQQWRMLADLIGRVDVLSNGKDELHVVTLKYRRKMAYGRVVLYKRKCILLLNLINIHR